jgi:hypothetical protein
LRSSAKWTPHACAGLPLGLLAQGQTDHAKRAWREALDNVDPEGLRTEQGPWLAEHLHSWVARAWLELGDAAQALAVIRSIPDAMFAKSERLSMVRQEVLDAVEADALGDSVYPRSFDVAKRWQPRPRHLPAERNGHSLLRFFPGRVIEANDTRVRILYGERRNDGSYRAHVTELDSRTWKKIGFGSSSTANGYVELGVYADESQQIVAFEEGSDGSAPARSSGLPLAYFDRWR